MQRAIPATLALVLILTASSIASPTFLPIDEIHISGRVVESATGGPLAGVQVTVPGTNRATLTGASGSYRLTLQRGSITGDRVAIRFALIGYEVSQHTVRIGSGAVQLDVRLTRSAVALEEVVAVGYGAARTRDMDTRRIFSMSAPEPGLPRRPRTDWNTEAYDRIEDNAFMSAVQRPLSTFSIDVDRASYSNVRRFLIEGLRPPRDAVRIEEMINYFPYAYAAPSGEHPFSVDVEVGEAPWKPLHRLVRIGLQSQRVEMADLPPNNLVFLIDVSGSMFPPDRLPLAKQSLRLLVEQLRETDRVAVVVYAGAAGVVLPSTPGSEKMAILDAIERLEAGGSTAGGAGIRLAYDIARQNHIRGGNNRVILATDGDFNVGPSSDGELVRLIEEKREQGTFLTILGFGRGNLKDAKMEKLSGHGNGNYAYIDNLMEARKALVTELGATLVTVAKDVKLQVEFNPARVQAYRLIGYENRLLADEDFNDDAKDAGDLGAGHSVTALYEVIPAGVRSDVDIRGVDSLRYQLPNQQSGARGGEELAFVKIRYKAPDGEKSRLLQHAIVDSGQAPSGDFVFAAAVAGFGMLLRESEHRGSISVEQVIALASGARGKDDYGFRSEFIRLVELYQGSLAIGASPRGW